MSLSLSLPRVSIFYLYCSFFEVTQKLRNLPLAVTHEDVLLPEVQ